MKKKIFLIITTFIAIIYFQDVYACGEIKELTSSIGTVSSIGEMKYLVTVPAGTQEVTLYSSTDYSWVEGYGPRTVSTTEGTVELQVDGNACGFGIYSYFIEFKELSNLIAENDPLPQEPTTAPTEPEQTPDPAPSEPVNYGVLQLTKLTIAGLDFTFNPETRVYDLEIDDTLSKLDITTGTQDNAVSVTISDNVTDLKDGMNVVLINLSDPYGNTGLYILNVNRTKMKSSNNYLASLAVEKYQLNFDPSITSYTVEIGKESVLNITAVTESELASYIILGNTNINDGDTITVRVTAENGERRDYTITVKRGFNIMDYWIYIVIVLLIVLLLLIFMISKQKKNKKKMGPATIEGQTETAGVVQEMASQNLNSADSATTQEGMDMSSSAPITPGTLKIIEPTNLDTPPETQTEPTSIETYEEENPTEVFQL